MNADSAEIVPETRLHEGAVPLVEGFSRRAQDIANDRRNFVMRLLAFVPNISLKRRLVPGASRTRATADDVLPAVASALQQSTLKKSVGCDFILNL
jgi:hypothetical protein